VARAAELKIPALPREKLLGRTGFYIEIFFPKFENDFKTGFSRVKVWHFTQEGGGP
jgi:hypothetical protein